MNSYAQSQRRDSGEHRRPYQGQHRHDQRRHDEEVIDISHRDSHGEDKARRRHEKKHNQQDVQIAKFATLMLAAGLGFGAGLVYSRSRKSRGQHHKDAESQRPYRIESRVEGYENQGRLEYRQPDDRMSHRGGSVRDSHGSGYWQDQSDGYSSWR